MKRRAAALLLASAALAGTAVLAAGCDSRHAEAACNSGRSCLPPLKIEDIDHHPIDANALDGKVVVVNFWATWCGPCNREIPAFNRVYTKYKDKGVVMLGMLDDNQVDDNGLLNFMSDHELTYPVVRVNGDILSAFEYPNALPTTFVYDRHGKVQVVHRGPFEEDDLSALLDKLLR
ncbi:MAG TPA: TlpA disulfide reductase family protein [Kofleriaceae bacterium]|nr:TlpA disulfide reductase family protein [Kofleriaceae bacterium]